MSTEEEQAGDSKSPKIDGAGDNNNMEDELSKDAFDTTRESSRDEPTCEYDGVLAPNTEATEEDADVFKHVHIEDELSQDVYDTTVELSPDGPTCEDEGVLAPDAEATEEDTDLLKDGNSEDELSQDVNDTTVELSPDEPTCENAGGLAPNAEPTEEQKWPLAFNPKSHSKRLILGGVAFLTVLITALAVLVSKEKKQAPPLCDPKELNELKDTKITVTIDGLNRTITASERQAIQRGVVDTYNNVSGLCDDVYERWMYDSWFINQEVINENGDSYLSVDILTTISCNGCPDEESFASVFGDVAEDTLDIRRLRNDGSAITRPYDPKLPSRGLEQTTINAVEFLQGLEKYILSVLDDADGISGFDIVSASAVEQLYAVEFSDKFCDSSSKSSKSKGKGKGKGKSSKSPSASTSSKGKSSKSPSSKGSRSSKSSKSPSSKGSKRALAASSKGSRSSKSSKHPSTKSSKSKSSKSPSTKSSKSSKNPTTSRKSSKKGHDIGVCPTHPTPSPTPTSTKEPTTKEPTTKEPTTKEPTTKEPTTKEPTTKEPTTKEPTTKEPTTKEPTTKEPTTKEPTTKEPTTKEPTTKEPTTKQPSSVQPTTTQFVNQCNIPPAQCPWNSSNSVASLVGALPGLCRNTTNTCQASDCQLGAIKDDPNTCSGGNQTVCQCLAIAGKIGVDENGNDASPSNICGGGGSTGTCNYNYGNINGTINGNICNGQGLCNCNGCEITDACTTNNACNYNSGVIRGTGSSGSSATACGCQNCCNFNGYETGVTVGETCGQDAFIQADCGNDSCNCNRGRIISECTGQRSCNNNAGIITAGCTRSDSCNDVPSCLKIRSGCDSVGGGNTGECNFASSNEDACLADKSTFISNVCTTFSNLFAGEFSYCYPNPQACRTAEVNCDDDGCVPFSASDC